jgi:hypothetical protein
MWDDEGTARADIIKILISLALLSLRFDLYDPLLRQSYDILWFVTLF